MLDIKLIRSNPESVRSNLRKREDPENLKMLDELIKHDTKWRQSLTELNNLRHQRRLMTTEIAMLRKGGDETSQAISRARKIDKEIKSLETLVNRTERAIHDCLIRLPNLLHESVPIGKGENDNVTVRRFGQTPEFSFPVKDHIDIGVGLGVIDIERAAKVAGARFYYLKGNAVFLDMALLKFALAEMATKGFVPVAPPYLMRRKAYEGVTSLDDFEGDLYKIEDEDLYLIATSEHPIAAMHMDEVLNTEELPLRFVGISANFRKEAGAHGRDTRGIFRTHQFNKVEQFVFSKPESSWEIHEELVHNAEELVQKLALPYRVVNVCTGDIGTVTAKRYDIEVWMPAQEAYRETISCSNCTDYQARTLNIRYREKSGAPPKGFVHTLNSTALATGRTIVAILENYQQSDGSVIVPEVLRKHMGGIRKMEPER